MIEIPPLAINDCGLADYPTGGQLGPRTMRDYEILWVERGLCRWEFDGQVQDCPPGSVLLCPPGMVDTWYWDATQTARHGYLHFEFIDAENPEFPLRRDVTGDDVLRPLLRHSVWLAGLGSADNDALAAKALQQALMWYVVGPDTPGRLQKGGAIHPVLKRALRALHNHWGDGNKVRRRFNSGRRTAVYPGATSPGSAARNLMCRRRNCCATFASTTGCSGSGEPT